MLSLMLHIAVKLILLTFFEVILICVCFVDVIPVFPALLLNCLLYFYQEGFFCGCPRTEVAALLLLTWG